MMNKKRTSLIGLGKYALSLPLFAFVFLTTYAWGTEAAISQNQKTANVTASSSVKSIVMTVRAPPTTKKTKDSIHDEKPTIIETKEILLDDEFFNTKNPPLIFKNNLEMPFSSLKDSIKILKIKSIQRIKDPSALVIYGDRGKNGVLLIITDEYQMLKDRIAKTVKAPQFEFDEAPSFPDGEKALYEYINKNIKYPQSAIEKGFSGRVMTRFVIEVTGEITNVTTVFGSQNIDCENEAIRVIKAMPKWKPGKMKGETVSVYYTLPIFFKVDPAPINKP